MATINTDGLSPMALGRLNKALDGLIRIDGEVMTWRASIAPLSGRKRESDGMASYSRTRFNRMTQRDQDAYIARLKAKRVYMLAVPLAGYDGDAWREVPKVIYDAVTTDAEPETGPEYMTDAECAALFGEA